MRRRCTLLVNILVVLGLVLSRQVAIASLPIETSQARIVARPGASQTDDAALAKKRENRQRNRRQDLGEDSKQERAQADGNHVNQQVDPKQANEQKDRQRKRERDPKRVDHAEEQVREGNWREFCTAADGTRLRRVDLCIHGADPAPVGLDVEQPVELPAVESALQATASLICEGDGQSGYRVQVL